MAIRGERSLGLTSKLIQWSGRAVLLITKSIIGKNVVTIGNPLMAQFYIRPTDEDRCRNAVITQKAITITVVTFNGTVQTFTGVVRTVENSPLAYPDFPLRVTMAG